MDKLDKEFDAFLRRFTLRQHKALSEPAVAGKRKPVLRRWVLAAAAGVVIALVSISLVQKFSPEAAPIAVIQAPGDSVHKSGEAVQAGEPIRSGAVDRMILSLEDGSRIEMSAQSELRLESASDGVLLRLNQGRMVVEAARQQGGHLYVEARDITVAVVGTVFFVEAQPSGARVAVLEGKV
jgi:transmembrane sensor